MNKYLFDSQWHANPVFFYVHHFISSQYTLQVKCEISINNVIRPFLFTYVTWRHSLEIDQTGKEYTRYWRSNQCKKWKNCRRYENSIKWLSQIIQQVQSENNWNIIHTFSLNFNFNRFKLPNFCNEKCLCSLRKITRHLNDWIRAKGLLSMLQLLFN